MSVQTELKKLNGKIKTDFDENEELGEKRDILIDKLRNSGKIASFTTFNQGSYSLHTGIKPEDDEEYDIDVAMLFSVNKKDFSPIEIKNTIYEVLKEHTDYGAEIKKSCVTVTYKKNGEYKFHVDLVVYAYEDKNDKDSQLYIGKGKSEDSQEWEEADPKGLVNYINDKIEIGEKRNQFRRIVRYLKKWRNIRFSNNGHCSPPSIGITLIAVDNFMYCEGDDLEALINIVDSIKHKFTTFIDEKGNYIYVIKLSLPYELKFKYGNNVFEKMTDNQMNDFKHKIDKLNRDLLEVKQEIDEDVKYKKLNKIFGDDFEIPGAKDSAKKQFNYIPNSSASGME